MRLNPFKGGGVPPPNDPEWKAWCAGYKQAIIDIKKELDELLTCPHKNSPSPSVSK